MVIKIDLLNVWQPSGLFFICRIHTSSFDFLFCLVVRPDAQCVLLKLRMFFLSFAFSSYTAQCGLFLTVIIYWLWECNKGRWGRFHRISVEKLKSSFVLQKDRWIKTKLGRTCRYKSPQRPKRERKQTHYWEIIMFFSLFIFQTSRKTLSPTIFLLIKKLIASQVLWR